MATIDYSFQDDEMATVEEILSFIDSCDLDGLLTVDATDETNVSLHEVEACTSPSDQTTLATATMKPKRKRIRTGWSSSTGLQRRKRAELEYLRAHVRELEEYLAKLKTNSSPTVRVGKEGKPLDWREAALEEFLERRKSEEANRVLKAIVGNQAMVSRTLNEAMRHRVTS